MAIESCRASTTNGAGCWFACAVTYSPTARASTELHTNTRIFISMVVPCRFTVVFCSLLTLVTTCCSTSHVFGRIPSRFIAPSAIAVTKRCTTKCESHAAAPAAAAAAAAAEIFLPEVDTSISCFASRRRLFCGERWFAAIADPTAGVKPGGSAMSREGSASAESPGGSVGDTCHATRAVSGRGAARCGSGAAAGRGAQGSARAGAGTETVRERLAESSEARWSSSWPAGAPNSCAGGAGQLSAGGRRGRRRAGRATGRGAEACPEAGRREVWEFVPAGSRVSGRGNCREGGGGHLQAEGELCKGVCCVARAGPDRLRLARDSAVLREAHGCVVPHARKECRVVIHVLEPSHEPPVWIRVIVVEGLVVTQAIE
jgi:hypothetical protein